MIAAILRAQWLSMRFSTRGRAVTLVVALIWYGMWTVAAWATGIAIAKADASALRIYLPVGLLGVLLAPVWSIWLGVTLLQGSRVATAHSGRPVVSV